MSAESSLGLFRGNTKFFSLGCSEFIVICRASSCDDPFPPVVIIIYMTYPSLYMELIEWTCDYVRYFSLQYREEFSTVIGTRYEVSYLLNSCLGMMADKQPAYRFLLP